MDKMEDEKEPMWLAKETMDRLCEGRFKNIRSKKISD